MTFSIPDPFLIPDVPEPEFRVFSENIHKSTCCKYTIYLTIFRSWFLNSIPALKPRLAAAFLIPDGSIYTYRDILTISPCMFIKAKGRNQNFFTPLLMENISCPTR